MASDEPTSAKLPEINFGQAIQRMVTPEQQKIVVQTNETIADGAIEKLIAAFEEASHVDDNGLEYWDARDLQKLLDYSDYRNFLNTVDKAKEACKTTGIPVLDHFVDVTDMIDIGKGGAREVETIKLTRYACYLIAQNGDARKRPIAFAQSYFAVQARRQELQDNDAAQSVPLHEDEKRLLLRDEIKDHNKKLASAAKHAGVVKPLDFAIFQNAGYQGLYGGLDRIGIQRKKGVKPKENILDYMGSTELAANLFRATQTEEKLRRDNIQGKEAANAAHHAVGSKVRDAIREIGGTMPEDLPTAENIVKVGRRLNKAIATSGKKDG